MKNDVCAAKKQVSFSLKNHTYAATYYKSYFSISIPTKIGIYVSPESLTLTSLGKYKQV